MCTNTSATFVEENQTSNVNYITANYLLYQRRQGHLWKRKEAEMKNDEVENIVGLMSIYYVEIACPHQTRKYK